MNWDNTSWADSRPQQDLLRPICPCLWLMHGCEYNEKLAAASNSGIMSRGESDWTISYAESSNSTEYQFPGHSYGQT